MNFKSLYSLSLFLNVTYATACNTWQFPFEEDANTPNIRSNSTGDLEDDKILQGKERTIPPRTATPPEKGKFSSTPPINITYPEDYQGRDWF